MLLTSVQTFLHFTWYVFYKGIIFFGVFTCTWGLDTIYRVEYPRMVDYIHFTVFRNLIIFIRFGDFSLIWITLPLEGVLSEKHHQKKNNLSYKILMSSLFGSIRSLHFTSVPKSLLEKGRVVTVSWKASFHINIYSLYHTI